MKKEDVYVGSIVGVIAALLFWLALSIGNNADATRHEREQELMYRRAMAYQQRQTQYMVYVACVIGAKDNSDVRALCIVPSNNPEDWGVDQWPERRK